MVMLKVWILECLTFQKAHHYVAYTAVLSVNVSFHLIY
jgi:hypothetical protein